MAENKIHLIERAAQRLQNAPGAAVRIMLAGPGPVPGPAADIPPVPAAASGPMPDATPDATPHAASGPVLDRAAMERAGLASWSNGRTRTTEELLVVQSELLSQIAAMEPGEAGNIIMVTSARPREGKSFTALNIAASMAHNSGRDVLLVDADTKLGNLTGLLGLSERPGLLDLARRPGTAVQGMVVRTAIAGLGFLPVGAGQDGHMLHSTTSAAAIISTLRANFAAYTIVLDVAACLASSDPAALAPLVGHVLLVVEAQQTQRNEIEAAIDLLHGCQNLVLMLNKIRLATTATFGGYYP